MDKSYKILALLYLLILVIGCKNQQEIEDEIITSNDFKVAQDAYFNGDYRLSIKHYSNLIKDYPDIDWLYMNRGDAYSDNGDVDRAIKDYHFVINKNGKDKGQAMLKSALTYFYTDDFEKSESIFYTITKLNPSEYSNEIWSAYYHLGQIAYKTKQFTKAIELYCKADQYSKTLLTNYHKANAFYSLGLIDSANVNFKKSIGFVKQNFIEMYPESAIAQCEICGFPFGSKAYELLTVPTREGHMHTMKKLEENKTFQDVIHNPDKYLDSTNLKNNKNIYFIK